LFKKDGLISFIIYFLGYLISNPNLTEVFSDFSTLLFTTIKEKTAELAMEYCNLKQETIILIGQEQLILGQ